MNFIRQWSDDELDELLLQSDEHLLRPQLQELVQEIQSRTNLPLEFWQRQENAIYSRISATGKRAKRLPRLIWASATLCALAAVLVLQGGIEKQAPPPVQAVSNEEADHELLIHVEEVIQSGGPAALEPAAMLAVEIGEYSAPRNGTVHKERTQ